MPKPRGSRRYSSRSSKKKESPKGFILSIVDGRMEGKEFHYEKEAIIGRVEECEVTIIDPGISREHAKVSGRRGVFIVEDMGSSNGTRLNGEVIDGPEVLRDGDYVTVGAVNIMFSNLEMDKAGDPTEKMHLSKKQLDKLDHTRSIDLGDLPPIKEILTPPRVGILAVFGILFLALPFLTRRILEMAMVVVLLGGAGAGLWFKSRHLLTKILQKTALFAGVLFGVLFIAIVVGRIFPPSHKIKQQQEWSSYIIDYINYEQSGGYNSWGLGYQTTHQYYGDINYRDKIVFKYYKTPQRQRLTLEYAACGISEGEVAIFLNEERLTYLPIVEACTYNLKVLLPADKIKTGNNLIIFDNLRNNNKGTETWLISYIKIREEAIPKADPAQAQQNFRLGMRMYDEREVDPRNRQKAIKHFRLVRDYLETLKKKPNLYREATRMIRIIDKQLQRRFQGSIFEAQRLVNYGKYERAKKIILKAMSYFESDKKDARYLKLQSALTQLSG